MPAAVLGAPVFGRLRHLDRRSAVRAVFLERKSGMIEVADGIVLRAIPTPGHIPEHLAYLLLDERLVAFLHNLEVDGHRYGMATAFDDLRLSSVVLAELEYGAAKSRILRHRRNVDQLLAQLPLVPFTEEDAAIMPGGTSMRSPSRYHGPGIP